jgi:hypothetical protein
MKSGYSTGPRVLAQIPIEIHSLERFEHRSCPASKWDRTPWDGGPGQAFEKKRRFMSYITPDRSIVIPVPGAVLEAADLIWNTVGLSHVYEFAGTVPGGIFGFAVSLDCGSCCSEKCDWFYIGSSACTSPIFS